MADMESLRIKFDQAMFDIYRRAREEAGYPANLFLKMLTEKKGLATAKQLINANKPSDGYTALYERNRLDLTVEALIVENLCWQPLFEKEEIAKAKMRLESYNYKPRPAC